MKPILMLEGYGPNFFEYIGEKAKCVYQDSKSKSEYEKFNAELMSKIFQESFGYDDLMTFLNGYFKIYLAYRPEEDMLVAVESDIKEFNNL